MVETRSAFAASSIRRRSAAWTILLDRKDGVRGSSPFAEPRLCTVLAAKGSTATLFGIYVEDTVSAKPRWTIVRFSSKGAGPDGARPGARSRSAVADTGARLGGYPAPGVEVYRQEKSVASRGRGDLFPAAGAVPRFSRGGFGLRSGREPSGCGE